MNNGLGKRGGGGGGSGEACSKATARRGRALGNVET